MARGGQRGPATVCRGKIHTWHIPNEFLRLVQMVTPCACRIGNLFSYEVTFLSPCRLSPSLLTLHLHIISTAVLCLLSSPSVLSSVCNYPPFASPPPLRTCHPPPLSQNLRPIAIQATKLRLICVLVANPAGYHCLTEVLVDGPSLRHYGLLLGVCCCLSGAHNEGFPLRAVVGLICKLTIQLLLKLEGMHTGGEAITGQLNAQRLGRRACCSALPLPLCALQGAGSSPCLLTSTLVNANFIFLHPETAPSYRRAQTSTALACGPVPASYAVHLLLKPL